MKEIVRWPVNYWVDLFREGKLWTRLKWELRIQQWASIPDLYTEADLRRFSQEKPDDV
jgi:hypothetical protein